MLLLGCKPPGRHTEQHDVFFGIAESLSDLIPEIKAFWPEPEKIHIDAWREVTYIDGYRVNVINKGEINESSADQMMKLFFVNLGGYQPGKFEEQHYIVLTVQENRAAAFKASKKTLFFQNNHFEGASSHIDDKYGIDIDDLYEIEDILSASQKEKYQIELIPEDNLSDDQINLGYFRLEKL
jgi:hypothetical protein